MMATPLHSSLIIMSLLVYFSFLFSKGDATRRGLREKSRQSFFSFPYSFSLIYYYNFNNIRFCLYSTFYQTFYSNNKTSRDSSYCRFDWLIYFNCFTCRIHSLPPSTSQVLNYALLTFEFFSKSCCNILLIVSVVFTYRDWNQVIRCGSRWLSSATIKPSLHRKQANNLLCWNDYSRSR